MNSSNLSSQNVTYLQHKNAVDTVARFLNVPVTEVLPTLDRKVRANHPQDQISNDPFYDKHCHAINSVARYVGRSIDDVLANLERRLHKTDSSSIHSRQAQG